MKKRPITKFNKKYNLMPYVGVMASESKNREQTYLKQGCNYFGHQSQPIGFWTEQDILEYLLISSAKIDQDWIEKICILDRSDIIQFLITKKYYFKVDQILYYSQQYDSKKIYNYLDITGNIKIIKSVSKPLNNLDLIKKLLENEKKDLNKTLSQMDIREIDIIIIMIEMGARNEHLLSKLINYLIIIIDDRRPIIKEYIKKSGKLIRLLLKDLNVENLNLFFWDLIKKSWKNKSSELFDVLSETLDEKSINNFKVLSSFNFSNNLSENIDENKIILSLNNY